VAAVIGGGFLLGHGDHLGAFCMQHIPPGLAFPLYAGTALLLGSLLNLVQARASPRHLHPTQAQGGAWPSRARVAVHARERLHWPHPKRWCTAHALHVACRIFVHRSDTRLA
jgi:hypothetical protein